MPPFHREKVFFNIVTTINSAFSPAKKQEPVHHRQKSASRAPTSPLLKHTIRSSLCSHPLFTLHKHTACVNECQRVPSFSTWKNSMAQLCFIYTSLSGVILSDCPSAAFCCAVTKCNEKLVGSFILYSHVSNICLWCWADAIKSEALLS